MYERRMSCLHLYILSLLSLYGVVVDAECTTVGGIVRFTGPAAEECQALEVTMWDKDLSIDDFMGLGWVKKVANTIADYRFLVSGCGEDAFFAGGPDPYIKITSSCRGKHFVTQRGPKVYGDLGVIEVKERRG